VVRFSVRISLLLAATLAFPGAALAASITGVVSEQGRPIAGAAVVVDAAEPILTDQDGKYTAEVDAGDRKVKVALRGYKPMESSVTVAADKTATADFVLEPLLQIAVTTAPQSLARNASAKVEVAVTNGGTAEYAIEAAGLRVYAGGKDRTADFTVTPAAGNATSVKAGQAAMLSFDLKAGANAPTGQVTFRAGLFAFDTSLGKNLIANGGLETGDDPSVAEAWTFGIDNKDIGIEAEGTIAADSALVGNRSAKVNVTASPEGDVRAYWGPPGDNWIDLKLGATYVLSGYVKTENVEAPQFGAAVYIPVVGDNPYQQPNAPWITGTRDWRKAIITFKIAEDADSPRGVPRGEIQQGTGIAWFDNFSLTEGAEDGSLTVTSPDQTVEITGG
jgi:hypothetical protein